MSKLKKYVQAPRIEIVLVPDEQGGISNKPSELFDIWCVLHVPDGKDPTTVRVDGGPYDRPVHRVLTTFATGR
jgi:hypothetical protein